MERGAVTVPSPHFQGVSGGEMQQSDQAVSWKGFPDFRLALVIHAVTSSSVGGFGLVYVWPKHITYAKRLLR